MDEIDSRVGALLAAPLGCAFLLAVDESRLTPAQAVQPATAFAAAAHAVREIEIWHGDTHEEEVAQIMERGQRLHDLARAILREPESSWWSAPVDLDGQLCVWPQYDAGPPGPAWVRLDERALRSSRYAQKPWSLWTSTMMGGEACMRAFMEHGAGDWGGIRYHRQWLLRARRAARVFEITGPDAWHALCLRYPIPVGEAAASDTQGKWPDPERLTVDWAAAANDWDGVHLTFGGLLTSEQVPRRTPEGWSVMWGWESEMTVWLRWVFDDVERLPDYERIERDPGIRFPFIRTRSTESKKYFGP